MRADEPSEPLDWESIPDFYCPDCTALRFEGEPSCAICDAPRPEGGWEPVGESEDPFLGSVVDERYLIAKRDGERAGIREYRAELLEEQRVFTFRTFETTGRGSELGDEVRDELVEAIRVVQVLENPNIVPIYELLELHSAPVAVVTEYVPGRSARDLVESEGPVGISRAADIGVQIGGALADAHAADVHHGDVRPLNIELLDDGPRRALAFLRGFGASRVATPAVDEIETLSDSSSVEFASPRQLEDGPPRSFDDVYGLGATLYYLLSGRPPFVADDPAELARMKREQAPLDVNDATPGREIPAEFDALVRSMLARDPARRPAGMDEVIDRLGAFVEAPAPSERETPSVDWTETGVVSRRGAGSGERSALDPGEDSGSGDPPPPDLLPEGTADGLASSSDFASVAQSTAKQRPLSEIDDSESGEQTAAAEPGAPEALEEPSEGEGRRLAADSSVELAEEDSEGDEGGDSDREGWSDVLSVRTVDGERFAIKDTEAEIWLYDSDSGSSELLSTLTEPTVDLDMRRRSLWIARPNGTLRHLNLDLGSEDEIVIPKEGIPVSGIGVSDDEDLLVTASRRGVVCVRTAGANWMTHTPVDRVRCCAVAADATGYAIADGQRRIHVFGEEDPAAPTEQFVVESEAVRVVYSGGMHLVGVVQRNGSVAIHDAETGWQVAEFESPKGPPHTLYFSDEYDVYFVHSDGRSVVVTEAGSDELVATFP